jgi:hypothetical protein
MTAESTRSAASAESPQTTIILADDPVITNNSTVDAVGFTGLFFRWIDSRVVQYVYH